MEKKKYLGGTYEGERALFMLKDAYLEGVTFQNGESPLKESSDLELLKCSFKWKYPLWYANNISVKSSCLMLTARSGIWYTHHINMDNCIIDAPKTFRRSSNITLNMCSLNHADETFWMCSNITLNNVAAKGDYFMMNTDTVTINHLELDGNYFLDGAKNVIVRDSILNSKDSFWNTENVVAINCKIIGEYLGWNSKNLTFINCEISSLQGLCYIKGLKMINCKLLDTSLCFEYCENIDADIIDEIVSIKNPTSGIIRAKGAKEIIIDNNSRDYDKKTRIILNNKYEI